MKKTLTLLTAIILLFTACSKKSSIQPQAQSNAKAITKFVFTKADNPSLTADVEGTISENEINVVLHGVDKTNLKATVTHTAKTVNTVTNFSNPVTYTLAAEDGTTANYIVKVENRDVYILGEDLDPTTFKSTVNYWKNGTKVVIPQDPSLSYDAKAIGVIGNDVYIAGTISDPNAFSYAGYWKNGTLNRLSQEPSSVTAMVVSGNDIYIAGTIYDTNTAKYRLVYWKNGIKTELDNGDSGFQLNSMKVIDNDVYLIGSFVQNSNYTAGYWKNGSKILLGDGTGPNAFAFSIAVNGSNTYLFGEEGPNYVYWKNAIKTQITMENGASISNFLAVDNDIYLFGLTTGSSFETIPTYWKNNTKKILTGSTGFVSNLHVTNINSDFYILGREAPTVISNDKSIIYWINEKPVKINNQSNIYLKSIVVKQN